MTLFVTVFSGCFTLLLAYILFRIYVPCKHPTGSNAIVLPDGFSLIIPFRNEEKHLSALLRSLVQQNLSIPYEIILINDSSNDQGVSIVTDAIALYPTSTIRLLHRLDFPQNDTLTSKQHALDIGVHSAQYSWLVFTDADMVFDNNWLEMYRISAEKTSSPFLFGRTDMLKTESLLDIVQREQLRFLFAIAWIFTRSNIDSSCMGNNIAITRNLYDSIGGQQGLGYSLIEDKRLLSAIRKRGISPTPIDPFFPQAFTFPVNLRTFVHQMLRWIRGGIQESIQLSIIIFLFILQNTLIPLTIFLENAYFLPLINLGLQSIILLKIYTILRIPKKGLIFLPIIFIFETLILVPALFCISPQWKGKNLIHKRKCAP